MTEGQVRLGAAFPPPRATFLHRRSQLGTPVAGTAGAATNNSVGISGVAWNCMIMPLRVSSPGGIVSWSNLATALSWAADHRARVANISFAFGASPTVSSAAQYFQSHGGVVTVSAGNYSTVHINPDNPYLLVVSATDSGDKLTTWNDTGSDIDLAAPGVSIPSTWNGGGYGSRSGSSMSVPIVAGVAALAISANPSLTASQVQDRLGAFSATVKQSADDLGPAGGDPSYGWGRINAGRAVALAAETRSPPPGTTPPTVSSPGGIRGVGPNTPTGCDAERPLLHQ
ncbi:MAG TPA: S8 family serine peptidase [Phycisphaerae bacterium]|nr:S8 family serine peptidase [Phycisphaerae bacterium]